MAHEASPGTTPASQIVFSNDAQTLLEIVCPANPLPVYVTSGAVDQDVNLVGINGVAPVTGSGTSTAALRVELPTNGTGVVGLNAGTANVGNVGGKTVSVTVTPTVTATNAYGTNYVVGGLLTFSNALTATGSGIVQSVAVTCKKVETSGFTLFLFNSNPSNTTWTDAAVANINAADVAAIRGNIPLTANSQLGTCTFLNADGLGMAVAPGATTLYGILLANAALTNQFGSTSDITVTIKVLQDL